MDKIPINIFLKLRHLVLFIRLATAEVLLSLGTQWCGSFLTIPALNILQFLLAMIERRCYYFFHLTSKASNIHIPSARYVFWVGLASPAIPYDTQLLVTLLVLVFLVAADGHPKRRPPTDTNDQFVITILWFSQPQYGTNNNPPTFILYTE